MYGVPLGLSVILMILPSSTWASNGHPAAQSLLQLTGIGAAAVYGFVVTVVLGLIIHKTIGFTVKDHEEEEGLDVTQHNETAYRLT